MIIKEYIYLELYNEMRRHKETLKQVADLLNVTPQTISKKLAGTSDWTISEIETLCSRYKKDYYELFKKD